MRLQNDIVILNWPLIQHILTQGMYSSSGVWHGAIDMRCTWDGTTRQPVYAAEDGVVNWVQTWDGKSTEDNQSYGNAVKIRHADYNGQTLETRYAHLSSYVVKNGQHVEEGQLIGYTGNTGKSSGAHLHFEVILGGTRRNPLVWLNEDFTTAWDTVYTYGPGEGPVKREEKEETTMELKSDTFKIGPAGTNDRAAVKEVADRLKINNFEEGDYIIVGPMSGNDRTTIYNKAISLSLGCYDYVPSNSDENSTDKNTGNQTIDITPILEKLEKIENQITQGFEQSQKNYEVMESSIKLISDKLSAAGKAME